MRRGEVLEVCPPRSGYPEEEASLRLTRLESVTVVKDVLDDEGMLDTVAVELEAVMGGDLAEGRSGYRRSLSDLERFIAYTLSSVPSFVRVGLVVGADIALLALVLSPLEIVPTGMGERVAGPSLSYGTERSVRSVDVWRGRGFLRPKNESMARMNTDPPRAQL